MADIDIPQKLHGAYAQSKIKANKSAQDKARDQNMRTHHLVPN
jgi:hypothetical protein